MPLTNEDSNLVLDIANKNHATNNIWPGALLVDQGEGSVEVIGN